METKGKGASRIKVAKKRRRWLLLIGFLFLGSLAYNKGLKQSSLLEKKIFSRKETVEAIIQKNFQEKKFDDLLMIKYNSSNSDRAPTINKVENNAAKVEKVLQYFKGMSLNKQEELYDDQKYRLSLYNDRTYEKLNIIILNKKHIKLYITLVEKEIDSSKDATTYEESSYSAVYKIQDREIDLKELDRLFSSLE